MATQGVMKEFRRAHDVFVSYAHEDTETANSLASALATEFDVFIDSRSLVPGSEWYPELRSAIAGSAVLVVVLTNHWLASTVCADELVIAQQQGKSIVLYHAAGANAVAVPPVHPLAAGRPVVASTSDDLGREVRELLPVGRLQARLELAADNAGRSSDFQGERGWLDLMETRAVLAKHGRGSSPAVREFAAALAKRRREKRLRLAVIGVVALALAFGGVVFDRLAGRARLEQETAVRRVQAEDLARRSQSEDSFAAARFALAAVREAPTQSAIEATRRALTGLPPVEGVSSFRATPPVLAVGLIDAASAVAVDSAGSAVFGDGAVPLAGLQNPVRAVLSEDGSRAAVLDAQGRLAEWNPTTGELVRTLSKGATALANPHHTRTLAWAEGEIILLTGEWEDRVEAPGRVAALALNLQPRVLAAVTDEAEVWACDDPCTEWHKVGALADVPDTLDFMVAGDQVQLLWRAGVNKGLFERLEGHWRRGVDGGRFSIPGGYAFVGREAAADLEASGFVRFTLDPGASDDLTFTSVAARSLEGETVAAVARSDGLVQWRTGLAAVAEPTDWGGARRMAPVGLYDGALLVADDRLDAETGTKRRVYGAWTEAAGFQLLPIEPAAEEAQSALRWATSRGGRTAALVLTSGSTVVWHDGIRLGSIPVGDRVAVHPAGGRLAAVEQ